MSRRPRRPSARDVDGVLLLDKPLGVSSNGALQTVRRLFNARKAGHTGSLDPLASGMLPVCLGEATKISQFLLDADKHYEVLAVLGVRSTTGDLEGELLPDPGGAEHIDAAALEQAIAGLRGSIEQLPPMHSAVKQDGKRLYKLARTGVAVERAVRQVRIEVFEWIGGEPSRPRLRVHCSKGTYIRSLVEDLGEALGCGAYVHELRRSSMVPFENAPMVSLEQLQALHQDQGMAALDELLLDMDSALADMPIAELEADQAHAIAHGQKVDCLTDDASPEALWRMYAPGRRFIGIGRTASDGLLAPARLLSTARSLSAEPPTEPARTAGD